MRTLIILLLLILTSCIQKEESKFQKINYNVAYNYLDSLGKKIIPDKNYQYWQYATYYQGIGDQNIKYTVLKHGGDTLLRKKISEKINPNKIIGIFQGGHPSYRCNYAVTIENQKVNYIKTEDEFRTFLGTIDNLEEAILLAITYGYVLDHDIRGSAYRKVTNGFELHLTKYHDFPLSKESIEIKINKNGFIKTKSLGIYCEGRKCMQ
ncbi:hypothetical protein ACFFLS_08915 [Flavobacterium procerum]|uniref:Lipoprotein n=1 Tax=Flavobacterium procerum TaxID=1455569 RepID=A0ABV6BP03_9FLAO